MDAETKGEERHAPAHNQRIAASRVRRQDTPERQDDGILKFDAKFMIEQRLQTSQGHRLAPKPSLRPLQRNTSLALQITYRQQ